MPTDDEIEKAAESAEEARQRAEKAARWEQATHDGIAEKYGGNAPEQAAEEIDQPPRQ